MRTEPALALRSPSTLTLALALALLAPTVAAAQSGAPAETSDERSPEAPAEALEADEDVVGTGLAETEAEVPEADVPDTGIDVEAPETPAVTLGDEAPDEAPEAEPEADAEDASPPAPDAEFGVRATAELGFLAVLAHELTLGADGTPLDYPGDFNQSNLYLFVRVSAEFDIWRQHLITFVYQPLQLDSQTTLARDVRIDGLDFAAGTPVTARYGFPFYRFGWAFDVLEAPTDELAFGLGLQIRNATIQFASADGALYRSRQDVGPVPLLRARGRFELPTRFFFAFEVDGFYAFIPGINGSDNNVEGAILDASVRFGWRAVDHVDAFLNVRYIGGGAAGQGDPDPTNDGFQANWLHFLTASLGITLDSRR